MGEILIGNQLPADVGLRVHICGEPFSIGTITAVMNDGKEVSVEWDAPTGKEPAKIATGLDGSFMLVAASGFTTQNRKYVSGNSNYSSGRSVSYDAQEQQYVRYTSGSATGISASGAGVGGNPWPTENGGSRYSMQPVESRRWTSKNVGADIDWLDRLTGMASDGLFSVTQDASEVAKISRGRTTVGLSVYGTFVDYVVPGGPAQLCQQLQKKDEIIMVDGRSIDQDNLTEAILGNDQVNTTVKLTVRKAESGRVMDVDLVRVSKQSMENMVRLFELLTVLKQNGHNNEDFEMSSFRGGQDTTLILVDKVVSLISVVQTEKYEADMRTRNQFQSLYNEMRDHLQESYAQIDALEAERSKDRQVPEAPKGVKTAEEWNSLVRTLDQIKVDLRRAQEDANRSNLLAAEAKSEHQQAMRELDRLRGEMKSTLDESHESADASSRELERQSREIERLLNELEAATSQNAMLNKEVERARALAAEAKKARSLEMDNELLRVSSTEKETDYTRRIQQLEGELNVLRAVAQEKEEERKKAEWAQQERVRELEEALARLRSQLQDARDEAADTRAVAAIAASGGPIKISPVQITNLPQGTDGDVFAVLSLDDQEQSQDTPKAPASRPVFSDCTMEYRVKATNRALTATLFSKKHAETPQFLGQAFLTLPSLLPLPNARLSLPFTEGASGKTPLLSAPNGQQCVLLFKAEQPPVPPPAAPVRDLSPELAAARESLKESNARLEGSEGKLAAARETISDLKKMIASLEAKVAALHKERELLSEQMMSAESKSYIAIHTLESTLEVRDKQIRGLQEELDNASKARSRDVEAAMGDAEGWRKKAQEYEARLNDALRQLREHDASNEGELAAWKKKCDEFETRMLESLKLIRERESQVERLRSELDATQGQAKLMEQLKGQLRRQDELINSLEKRVEEQDAWQHQIVTLQEQVRKLEAARSRLEEELKIARAAVEEARKVQQECDRRRVENERLQDEVASLQRKLRDAMDAQAKMGSHEMSQSKQYQAEILKLHNQVELLQKQWQANRNQDKEVFEREQAKYQERVNNLLMQLDAKDEIINSPKCLRCGRGLVCEKCDHREIVTTREIVHHRDEVHVAKAAPPLGIVGLKIENKPPHRVLLVNEMMDPKGNIINDMVNVNDELQTIDGLSVHEIPVEDVVKKVAGPVGTIVKLEFSRGGSGMPFYAVTCLRHNPITQKGAHAATLNVQKGQNFAKYGSYEDQTASARTSTSQSAHVNMSTSINNSQNTSPGGRSPGYF